MVEVCALKKKKTQYCGISRAVELSKHCSQALNTEPYCVDRAIVAHVLFVLRVTAWFSRPQHFINAFTPNPCSKYCFLC